MTKLLGSAPTLEMVKTLLSRYFFSDSVSLEPCDDKSWIVKIKEVTLHEVKVIKKRDRYRVEMQLSET